MVTCKSPSSPAAMAWRPRGFLMRKLPACAACNSWLTSLTDRRARSRVELSAGAGADFAADGARRPMSIAPVPHVDRCRRRFPNARLMHIRQRCQGAKLGAERDPVVRFRHHSGLAGDRITQHRKAVPRANHEGIEPVEVFERSLQRPLQAIALARAPREIGSCYLAVVVGLEPLTASFQALTQAIMVGKRAVVHEAGVLASRKGVRARDGDGRLC